MYKNPIPLLLAFVAVMITFIGASSLCDADSDGCIADDDTYTYDYGSLIGDTFIVDGITYEIIRVDTDKAVTVVDCEDMDSVIIPATVEHINTQYDVVSVSERAFEGHQMEALVIPDSVTKVGKLAFNNCKELMVLVAPITMDCGYDTKDFAFKGVKIDGLVLSCGDFDPSRPVVEYWSSWKSSLTLLVVGEGITDFDTSFKGKKLIYLIMSSVTEVEKDQFKDCEDLQMVFLPSARVIGPSAFKDCESLNAVYLDVVDLVCKGAFEGCEDLEEYSCTSTKVVSEKGFYGCESLSSFEFGGTTELGNKAFRNTSVEKPEDTEGMKLGKTVFGFEWWQIFLFAAMIALVIGTALLIGGLHLIFLKCLECLLSYLVLWSGIFLAGAGMVGIIIAPILGAFIPTI